MKDMEQIVFLMKEEITKQADAEANHILQEIEEIKKNEKDKILMEAKKEAKLHKEAMLKKLNSEKAMALSSYNAEKTKALIDKRESYTLQLFEEVKEKLVAFCNSDAYSDFMKKKMSQYSFDEKVTVFVKKEDMKYEDMFKKQFDCIVKEGSITIGGFKIETKRQVVYDESLDSALKDQRRWFEDHSLMTLQ